MKTVLVFLAAFLLVGCGESTPRVLTQEQQAVVALMPAEEAYYVKECYKNMPFTYCLEKKQEIYHPVAIKTQEGMNPVTAGVLGYAAGAVIHGGKNK